MFGVKSLLSGVKSSPFGAISSLFEARNCS
jgi:hypothetical protein